MPLSNREVSPRPQTLPGWTKAEHDTSNSVRTFELNTRLIRLYGWPLPTRHSDCSSHARPVRRAECKDRTSLDRVSLNPVDKATPMLPNKILTPKPRLATTVELPGSKSYSNRAVLVAALADGTSDITGVLDSDDLRVMEHALRSLGVPIERFGTTWRIKGVNGQLRAAGPKPLHIDVSASGTGARFLTAAATLADGPCRLDGTARMRQRPIDDLVVALRGLGAKVDIEGQQGCPPLLCQGGGLSGGTVQVDASRSSQYVSALLQVAPYASSPVTLELKAGKLVSRPYVDLTIDVMAAFGVEASFDAEGRLQVAAGQRYAGRKYRVEPDASTAAYFFGAAAIAGGTVKVAGLPGQSRQADMSVLDLLQEMGCVVDRHPDYCSVTGPTDGLRAFDADMNAMPDAVLAMAVVAMFADGTTRIRNVANLRIKESDRLAALESELRRLGASTHTDSDSLTITPSKDLHGATIKTYDDHRMAMAFSMAGLRIPGVQIEDPGCVSKSFPGYFDLFDRL